MTANTATASTVPEPFGKPSGPGLWHVKGMELPAYIQHVAHDLLQSGHASSEQEAIKMAKGIVADWAKGRTPNGRGHVHPDVQAAAKKAIAEWEAKRARAHSSHGGRGHSMSVGISDAWDKSVELATKEALQQSGVASEVDTKKRLIRHMRDVHRLSGSHEHHTLAELHDMHHMDHMSGQVQPHPHHRTIIPGKNLRKTHLSNVAVIGVPMKYDAWGQPIELAERTKTVRYPNGSTVTHHSQPKPKKKKGQHIGFAALVARLVKQGKTLEEAKAIAAAIGRNKYGAAKFQKMAARGHSAG